MMFKIESLPPISIELEHMELDNNLIENNHEECSYPPPKKNKLISSGVTMRCRKIRRNLGHHVPNKLLSPEDFTDHVMLLFYPFSDENELLSDCPPLYQYKMQEQGVQGVVTGNKIKFEPYGDLVDQAFSQFNENSINNQDSLNPN